MTRTATVLQMTSAMALLALGACLPLPTAATPTIGETREVYCPELSWEPLPRPADLAADPQGALVRAEQVTYELRIYDRTTGSAIYERRNIATTTYQPPVLLDASHEYVWTVRPLLWLDGQRRVGDWLGHRGARVPAGTRVPPPLGEFARIELRGL